MSMTLHLLFTFPPKNSEAMFRSSLETAVVRCYEVVGTVSKLIKTCILRITPDKIYFILSEQAINGGIQIWCELSQGNFFDEYAMEGLSSKNNEIYLELTPDNLLRAMKTAHCAKWVKIKLTKKYSPCLTVEVDLPTTVNADRLVTHDIPVHIVPLRHWQDFKEPEMPLFDVSIALPQLKLLRNVVDKMKNLSNTMVLSANQCGEMKLSVETDMVSISTHFLNLPNPTWRKDDEHASQISQQMQIRNEREFVEAKIDIRRFAQFLSSQQVNPTRVICNIVHTRVLHIFLTHEDISLQYFMPAISSC